MRFVIFLLHLAIVFGRTFVDDAGVTHTTSAASPTVVTGSFEAISLMHFGVSHTQFRGTFGERATSGSNFGGVYADGNRADHGTHATGPYNPSLFPADPTAAELAGIAPIRDLSASCSATNYWCGSTFDRTPADLDPMTSALRIPACLACLHSCAKVTRGRRTDALLRRHDP